MWSLKGTFDLCVRRIIKERCLNIHGRSISRTVGYLGGKKWKM